MDGAVTPARSGPEPERFRQVLGHFCTGVTVITTIDDGAPAGFACQSFAALSLDPPLVRTLGLVEKRGRAKPPALRIVREAIMTLRSDEMVERQAEPSKQSRATVAAK